MMRNDLELAPGELIADRYRITRLIGVGGGGTVYEVIDPQVASCRLALKVFKRCSLGDADTASIRINEILALSRVNHENVLRLIDLVIAPPLLGFTTELLEGSTLRDFTDHPTRSSRIFLASCLRQVCEGLQAIHSRGLIHRDIKPENILISPGGRCKIADFGLARKKVDLRHQSEPEGTIDFMSPEQLIGSPGDERSDIYAVGLVGHLLLTGELPFAEDGPQRSLIRRTMAHPPAPHEIMPGCCRYLSAVINRAIQLHPDSRYQSAEQLVLELKRIEGLMRIEESERLLPPAGVERSGKTMRLSAQQQKAIRFMVAELTDEDAELSACAPILIKKTRRKKSNLTEVGEELAALPRDRTRRAHLVRASLSREITMMLLLCFSIASGSMLFAALAQPGDKPLQVVPPSIALAEQSKERTTRGFGAKESKSPVISNRTWWDRLFD